jgi:hypothetical protein
MANAAASLRRRRRCQHALTSPSPAATRVASVRRRHGRAPSSAQHRNCVSEIEMHMSKQPRSAHPCERAARQAQNRPWIQSSTKQEQFQARESAGECALALSLVPIGTRLPSPAPAFGPRSFRPAATTPLRHQWRLAARRRALQAPSRQGARSPHDPARSRAPAQAARRYPPDEAAMMTCRPATGEIQL